MQYSQTKGQATHLIALTKEVTATKIEVVKETGHDTVAFSKDAAIKARLVKQGGETL